MKRRWIIGIVAAALALLGVAGGVILAQEADGKKSRFGAFAERVADILGLEADDVENAMEQAKQEMAEEALDEKLAAMVEAGMMTQAEADEYKAWIESAPDSLKGRFGGPGGFGWHGKKRGHHRFGDRDGWKGWHGDKSKSDDDDA